MASTDSPERNRAFAESVGLPTPLLSDPTGLWAREFGVLSGTGKAASRQTFVIGAGGVVVYVDRNVNPARHFSDLAAALAKIGFGSGTPSTTD
jgi:peroxiredoxin